MSKFYAKNGQFWLDGQPVLIQSGEFHYFRTPRAEWRQRLDLLKSAGFNAVASYIPWLWHEVEEGVTDLDGHSHPMRDLAGFLDLRRRRMGLWIIARPGPYINAETIDEGSSPVGSSAIIRRWRLSTAVSLSRTLSATSILTTCLVWPVGTRRCLRC